MVNALLLLQGSLNRDTAPNSLFARRPRQVKRHHGQFAVNFAEPVWCSFGDENEIPFRQSFRCTTLHTCRSRIVTILPRVYEFATGNDRSASIDDVKQLGFLVVNA